MGGGHGLWLLWACCFSCLLIVMMTNGEFDSPFIIWLPSRPWATWHLKLLSAMRVGGQTHERNFIVVVFAIVLVHGGW